MGCLLSHIGFGFVWFGCLLRFVIILWLLLWYYAGFDVVVAFVVIFVADFFSALNFIAVKSFCAFALALLLSRVCADRYTYLRTWVNLYICVYVYAYVRRYVCRYVALASNSLPAVCPTTVLRGENCLTAFNLPLFFFIYISFVCTFVHTSICMSICYNMHITV